MLLAAAVIRRRNPATVTFRTMCQRNRLGVVRETNKTALASYRVDRREMHETAKDWVVHVFWPIQRTSDRFENSAVLLKYRQIKLHELPEFSKAAAGKS